MKYFVFHEDIILVSGAKRGLIYDLVNRRIFSVNETAKEYLEKLTSGKSLDEVLIKLSDLDKERLKGYLNSLCDNRLGYYSSKKIISGKLKADKRITNELNTVWFELRKACNLKCCHCYLDSNINSDKKVKVLDIENWKYLIDQLVEYSPKKIIMIGGEPLLFDKIDELINYCAKKLKNTDIVLYSNITILTDENIKTIVKNRVKVITSVYSNSSDIHDEITGTNGSFEKTISNIKKLKQFGVYVKANVVVMKCNSDNISDILEFTYKLTGIKSKVDVIRNIGHNKEYLLPENIANEYNSKRTRPYFLGIDKKTFIRNLSGNSCYQGKINIECDGKVSPCIMSERFTNSEYNIKNNSIKQIIDDYLVKEFWSISKDFIDECKDCEYRYVCKDCRPINIKDNNKYAKGNNCTYNPYIGQWI